MYLSLYADTIDARTDKEKEAGHLKMEIFYDKTQLYMG